MSDDEAEVKRQRNLRKISAKYGDEELKDVLATYSGRAVLSRITAECKIYGAINNDIHQTFRQLGHRDIGLWLRDAILTLDQDSAILMENEARKRKLELNN